MDRDLPCLGLFAAEFPLWKLPLLWTGDRRPDGRDGVFKESAGLWPRRCRGGVCETTEELWDIEGRVVED